MNKLFKFFLTSAAISAALVGAVSCQKDFAPDIESLNKKVAELTQKLTDLQTKIDAGEVVTNVTTTAGGITVTTNKGTYNIVNGKDGTNGTNGTNGKDGKDGSVVTIENGNWFIDGKDTGLAAAGKDGKNGEYYVPNPETGCFDKYTWDAEKGEYVKEATTISFVAPGTITAVWDKENNQLVFKGIEGKDPYTISLLAEVKSLVFMPATYIDGVEAMLFENFTYVPVMLKDKTKDSKNETQVDVLVKYKDKDGKDQVKVHDPVPVQPAIIAQYHVNPTNADLSFLKEGSSDGLEFIVSEADWYATRAEASEDFSVVPIFKSFENGILTVEVQVTGTPATDDLISVVALNVEKADGEFVTSDYATLQKLDLDGVIIAFKKSYAKENFGVDKEDAHLRRAIDSLNLTISKADRAAYINQYAAWTTGEDAIADAQKTCDISVKFDSSIDLNTIVAAHTIPAQGADVELSAAKFAELGLSWQFEVVKNYKIGATGSETPQDQFVTLTDGVFTPRVYTVTGEAAIGRTPIIRVALKHGDDVLQYGYIKVFISDNDAAFDAVYTFDKGFVFTCGQKNPELKTTVQYMNENIYNAIGMSKDIFHATYNTFEDNYYLKDEAGEPLTDENGDPLWTNVGTVEEIVNDQVEGTHILKWTISREEAWENAGEEIVHYVRYYSSSNPKVQAIIKLVAKVDAFLKEYNVPAEAPYYIPSYWKNEPAKNITYYNVAVPEEGSTDNTKCIFETDINLSFLVWKTSDVDKDKNQLGTPGSLRLPEDVNGVVTQVEYFFCEEDVEAIKKIGDLDVIFDVKAGTDSTELWAKFDKKAEFELVAKIHNEAKTLQNNKQALNWFEVNKASDVAKKLVNTDALYTFVGAKGWVCGKEDGHEVKITFNGGDHFRVNILRPVNPGATSSDYFVDARDKGEFHTFIRLEDLINPSDWRNRLFKDYENYWKYYGITKIEVLEDNIMWDAEGTKSQVDPAVVIYTDTEHLEITPATGQPDPENPITFKSNYGFLRYENGGQYAKEFNFYVKVKITYEWGVIESGEIKVPVHETEIL